MLRLNLISGVFYGRILNRFFSLEGLIWLQFFMRLGSKWSCQFLRSFKNLIRLQFFFMRLGSGWSCQLLRSFENRIRLQFVLWGSDPGGVVHYFDPLKIWSGSSFFNKARIRVTPHPRTFTICLLIIYSWSSDHVIMAFGKSHFWIPVQGPGGGGVLLWYIFEWCCITCLFHSNFSYCYCILVCIYSLIMK